MMPSSSSRRPAMPHILVIPFPAQGHILPLLDLVHHLCIRHSRSSSASTTVPPLTITVVVTPKNAPFLDPLLQLLLPSTISINALVLPLLPHPSLPAGAENVKDLPFAGYNAALAHAVSGLHNDILDWARTRTDNPPTAILADFFLGSLARALAADLGIPHLVFFCSGALVVAVVHHLWAQDDGSGVVEKEDGTAVSFPDIPGAPSFTHLQLPALYRRYRAGVPEWESMRSSMVANSSCYAAVINSTDALEGIYIEHLRAVYGHSRVWAVGPLEPAEGRSGGSRGGPSSVPAAELTSWLETCPVGSVVYVCFGSQYVTPRPHAAALAAALEVSGVRFVWVIKDPVGCEGVSATVVPEGFEERVAERGLVVRGWAPQVALLGHASVGAFLTHCGWNSVLEGVVAGVLLLTWPAEADQFINARLLVDELGVAARAWEGGHDAPAPEPGELAKVIAQSVGGGEGPLREVRQKATELGRKVREAVEAGGSSDVHWELLIKEGVMSGDKSSSLFT